MKTQIFHSMSMTSDVIKGLKRSLLYIFCLNSNLIKTVYKSNHYEDANFSFNVYDLRGY